MRVVWKDVPVQKAFPSAVWCQSEVVLMSPDDNLHSEEIRERAPQCAYKSSGQ